MHPPVMAGFLVILAVSGCASMKSVSPSAGRDVTQASVPPVSAPPNPPPPAAPPSEAEPSTNTSTDQSATPPKSPDTSTGTPAPVSPATHSSPAKTKPSAGARPVKQGGAVAAQSRPPVLPPAPPPSQSSSPAPAPAPAPSLAPASSPTLNLADLEQRLRETRAIGVFTKLSLKNQVDDLLDAFRALYRGPNKQPPPELRQRYDLLLLKVLTLLQDGDPPLAAAIASSREALWSILADPDKFATI